LDEVHVEWSILLFADDRTLYELRLVASLDHSQLKTKPGGGGLSCLAVAGDVR